MNDSRQAVFAQECDLIMKGGITSGIVYPLAITEIAKAFRLRSIGGTSAGAIAAAAAAAAELGRQRYQQGQLQQDPAGFAEIERLPEHLCTPAASGRGTKLLALFRPVAPLRTLFDTFIAILDSKGKSPWVRVVVPLKVMLARHKLAALLGALLAGGPLWWSAIASDSLLVWLWVALFAVLGSALAVVLRLLVPALREIPANGFGLCTGMPATDDSAPREALTTWLTQYLDRLSGQQAFCAGQAETIECERPLTFGDLRKQGIDLQVMTTCLSMARPFRLPFRDDDQVRENNQFHFREEEFARLFPRRVVDWMSAHQRPSDSERHDGYLRLPVPNDLPVIVAVRMSLSFPCCSAPCRCMPWTTASPASGWSAAGSPMAASAPTFPSTSSTPHCRAARPSASTWDRPTAPTRNGCVSRATTATHGWPTGGAFRSTACPPCAVFSVSSAMSPRTGTTRPCRCCPASATASA